MPDLDVDNLVARVLARVLEVLGGMRPVTLDGFILQVRYT